MRTCRHLAAFRIDVTVIDAALSGLPPWMSLCEQCAAEVVAALRFRAKAFNEQKNRGKLSRANRAHVVRVLDDLGLPVQEIR